MPRGGKPDDEPLLIPHGDKLHSASGVTATAAGLLASGGSVVAYRSIVVIVKVTGARDVFVVPTWSWTDASGVGAIDDPATNIAPAGATTRFIFHNLGDVLDAVGFYGDGGNSAMSYTIVGSNLDPLPASGGSPWAAGQGSVGVVSGVATEIFWNNSTSMSGALPTNSAFQFQDTGAGNWRLYLKPAGVYAVTVEGLWPGAAFDRYMELDLSNHGWANVNPRAREGATPDGDIQIVTVIFPSGGTGAFIPLRVFGFQASGINRTLVTNISAAYTPQAI